MKKIACILLLLVLLSGCAWAARPTPTPAHVLTPSPAATPGETPAITPTPTAPPTPEVTPSPDPTPKITPTPAATPATAPWQDVLDLSNQTSGWGFVRVKGARSEIARAQVQLMEQYRCVYLGSDTEKVLYLTFDEGYENGYTVQILDVLKRQNVPAAFFITGSYLKNNPALVRRMIDEGHTVGNHSQTHPSLPGLASPEDVRAEIMTVHDAVERDFGYTMRYFRPPMGEYSPRTLAITQRLGYASTFWSLAYRDWEVDNQKGTQHAYAQVMDYLHEGCVILLHAVSKDNANALEQIIIDARARGYRFKTLDEYAY